MAWIKRNKGGGLPVPITGHPGDDRLLQEIASRSPISSPRHWVHYLVFADEDAARAAAREVEEAGWGVPDVETAATGAEWVVIAEKDDAVLTCEAVQQARAFYDGIAARSPRTQYDGWEASV